MSSRDKQARIMLRETMACHEHMKAGMLASDESVAPNDSLSDVTAATD